MATEPFVPSSGNLSVAWAQILSRLLERGTTDLGPVMVNITDIDEHGNALEYPAIRDSLDATLVAAGKKGVSTVASTIFPQSMWKQGGPNNAAELYDRYRHIWPRIAKHPANRHGVYFQRLIAYQPAAPAGGLSLEVNQLDRIISAYNSGVHRRSVLQASIFDPTRDHSNQPYLGFPCLQQVAFTPFNNTSLAVTGFYAMQYHVEKAYGNYLGLARLGRFVGAQIGLSLKRVTCVAGIVQRGESAWTKAALKPLADVLIPVADAGVMQQQS